VVPRPALNADVPNAGFARAAGRRLACLIGPYNSHMRTITACFLIFGSFGWAHFALATEVYKCTVDGKTQYQGKPCEGSAPSALTQAEARSSLVGCYVTPLKGMEEGIVIRRGASSPYELVSMEGKNSQALPLKLATLQEMQQISSAFGVDVTEGLSIKWPADTPNQRPVGLYRGRDRAGKEVVLAYFFFDNGYATRSQCR
jgi:hypothetical protein